MDGWSDFSQEELIDNADYWSEVRFGGDARSDEEIKEAVYEQMREDDGYYDDHDCPESW